MTDDRLITAIGRLERALSRIEARGALPARAQESVAEGDERLQERYFLLRSRTQAAIDRLDRVLGEAGGEARRQSGNGSDSGS